MKKRLPALAVLLGASALLLTACGGTKIPSNKKLKKTLEGKSYTVQITEDEDLGSIVTAQKDTDYLYLYRLKSAQDCADFYDLFESGSTKYDKLVQFQDDSKLGNVVLCGTDTAIADSGIVLAEKSEGE
ncbi:MAG: hypothetical protein K5705_15725 [Oscillospiraceae bacterium]|nr:hypothetical protein [Oscillospiraceae bacterium]